MKICQNEQEFIDYVAPIAQKVCKRYGFKPSILIAQAFHENGASVPKNFDNDGIYDLMKYNCMIGQKASLLNDTWEGYSVWPGRSFLKRTPEEYGGKMTTINDYFRIFDSVEQSFADYILFLLYAKDSKDAKSYRYGPDVVNTKDPHELIVKVGKKYATGSSYAENVWNVVKRYDLTKYDDLSGVKPTNCIPPALKSASKSNVKKLKSRSIIDITAGNKDQVPASRNGKKIEFIVCHYLGVPNADNPDLYGGGYGGHYNIERNGKVYKAADPKTAVVWHCGGDLQGSGGHEFFKVCTNYNSIGIECGVCYTDTSDKEGDGDSDKWYFTEETQKSLVWLVSQLMDEYGIPIERVIRHYDVTGKICPNPYVKNNGLNGNWTWQQFKKNLAQYRKDGTIAIPQGKGDSDDPAITSITLKKGDRGEPVAEMQRMLIACGYSCGSYGADGVFGSSTEKTLKAFQKASGLKVDGLYGENSKNALTNAYAARGASGNKKTTANTVFLKAAKNVADTARVDGWTYGDSRSRKPCADKKISCDRLVARTLFDLGFRDQRDGGEVCSTLDKYLVAHGWKKVTQKSDIKAGAVIAVRNKSHSYIDHVFIVSSYNKEKDTCSKYDTGSDIRIKSVQPFKNVPLVEWSNRVFVCAWNVPAYLASSKPGLYVWDGVDYGAVFNPTYYSKMHKDLKDVFGTDSKKLFEHFLKCGMREGRQAYAGFCVHAYRDRYSDLKKAFGSDLPLYYKHYCEFGLKEKRIGT